MQVLPQLMHNERSRMRTSIEDPNYQVVAKGAITNRRPLPQPRANVHSRAPYHPLVSEKGTETTVSCIIVLRAARRRPNPHPFRPRNRFAKPRGQGTVGAPRREKRKV